MFWMTNVTIVTDAPRMAHQIAMPSGPLLRMVWRIFFSAGPVVPPVGVVPVAASCASTLWVTRNTAPPTSSSIISKRNRGVDLFIGGR